MMSSHRRSATLHDLFRQALPRAGRAADVHAESLVAALCDAALDRDDVRQEVLMALWAALRRFDPGRAALSTFVERITATCVVSMHRRMTAKKRRRPTDYEPTRGHLQLFLAVELHLDFDRVLGKLSHRDRKVAQLLAENGPARVARILRMPRSGVYKTIGRIRSALEEAGYGKI